MRHQSFILTSVVFVQNTLVNGISVFHDQITNEIPKILEPWLFELKMYRTNPVVGKLLQGQPPQKVAMLMNKTMYTLNLLYLRDKTISVVGGVTAIFNSSPNPTLVDLACLTGHLDTFDAIMAQKLTSQWQMLQTLKGEGGNSFEISVALDQGPKDKFIVRTATCFLHGMFKGFLVEFTYLGEGNPEEKIKLLVKKLGLEKLRLSLAKLESDEPLGNLTLQYTQALQI